MAEGQEGAAIRMLPHDNEAEKAILGTLLLDPGAWDGVASKLQASDFYSPANQIVFQALSDLVNGEGKPRFDAMILIDYLKRKNILQKAGGIAYVGALTSTQVISANLSLYCDIVKTASKRRLLFNLAARLEKDVFDPTVDVDDALDSGNKLLSDALLKGMEKTSKDYELGPVLSNVFEEIEGKIDGVAGEERVETGFDVLDKYTNGGFAKQEYIIIAARPSIGKSAFALSMMYNMIRNGKRVAFFSLEMPGKAIAQRLIAIDSKVDMSKIIKASFLGDEHERVVFSVDKLYEMSENLYIVDVPNISLTELKTKARILCKERKLDCIVIDYIGLISVTATYGEQKRFEQVSTISRQLKQLARELNIPLVVLCQVGRESEEQEPILSNLRDSGSIEQDADIVCFLHRKKNLSEEEKQRNLKDSNGRFNIQVTKMIVAKNRNGETGYFKIGFNGPLTFYADVAQDSDFIDYEPKDKGKK